MSLTRNLKHFTTLFEALKNNDVELDVATAAARIAESRAQLKAHGSGSSAHLFRYIGK